MSEERSLDEIQRAVAEFQAGRDREAAFAVVFERHFRPVRRFFARKGLPPEVCLDLTQETFFGIYKGLETYRPEARFTTWLYAIAHNAYLKYLRAHRADKRKGVEIDLDAPDVALEPASADDPLAAVLDTERRRRLREAVEDLPEQMRRCLKLRLDRGYSYRQIATLASISEQTVKAHLFQGRRRLREALASTEDGTGFDTVNSP